MTATPACAVDENFIAMRRTPGSSGGRMLQFGVLHDELTRRNMDMFAAEVMPHLKD
jgi:hypothetical protein